MKQFFFLKKNICTQKGLSELSQGALMYKKFWFSLLNQAKNGDQRGMGHFFPENSNTLISFNILFSNKFFGGE